MLINASWVTAAAKKIAPVTNVAQQTAAALGTVVTPISTVAPTAVSPQTVSAVTDKNALKQANLDAATARHIALITARSEAKVATITARQIPEIQATATPEAPSTTIQSLIPVAAVVIAGIVALFLVRHK